MLLSLLRVDRAKSRNNGSQDGFPACERSSFCTFDNIIARLIKHLVRIRENMQMAEGGERHGLEVATKERTHGNMEMAELLERVEAIVAEVVSAEGLKVFHEIPVESFVTL